MIINYFGKQFFKIQQGDLVIALNPISKDSKYKDKISRFGSNIVMITTNHPDFNGVDTATHGGSVPFVVSGPGDYEVSDVSIRGFLTETEINKEKYMNTIYSFILDDIKLCFLGSVSGEISNEIREAISGSDVLFVPIGGSGVLDPEKAYKLSLSLEPKIIIPMDYGDDKAKDSLKIFIKEGGAEKVEPIDKLTLKKKDLDMKDGEIIVFK